MDKKNFEQIVIRSKDQLYNYLLKIVKDPENAEDILQETFISFYDKMDRIKESSYLNYLYKTAYNKSINLIKKNKKQKTTTLNLSNPQHISSLKTYDRPEDSKKLLIKKAFLQLKPMYALLIDLKYYQKLSYKEIAQKLSLTVSAVDSRLVRAKKNLKKIILQDLEKLDVYNNKELFNEEEM